MDKPLFFRNFANDCASSITLVLTSAYHTDIDIYTTKQQNKR